MSEYKVVTVSNRTPREWYYMPDLWRKSLGDVEPLIITGEGYHEWDGLASKPKWLYRTIKDGKIPEEYMIYCDSWDLVFAAHPEEIMELYKMFMADIVINAEKNMFPPALKNEFDELDSPTEYKYLNSGFIVGKTEAILTCLEAMDLENVPGDHYDPEKGCNVHPEDQTLWQQIFLKQPVKIVLDHHAILCQTLHEADMSEFSFSGEIIFNLKTKAYPCAFHLNGSAKDKDHIRTPILKHLNLL